MLKNLEKTYLQYSKSHCGVNPRFLTTMFSKILQLSHFSLAFYTLTGYIIFPTHLDASLSARPKKGALMINFILFAGGLSFVSYLSYLIGRCSAVHDLCDGRVCEDLEAWIERYSHDRE